jgi:catechol 2,3-dioxygenase-like lactoylglutathione lyase family enzyme
VPGPRGAGLSGTPSRRRAAPARGLRHLALKSRDLAETERFYTGVLGFEVAFTHRGMTFLRSPGGDDLLNFVRVRGRFDPEAGGLEHFGIRVPRPQWRTLLASLDRAGVAIRGRRGRSAVYVRDPNGYTVELYCD